MIFENCTDANLNDILSDDKANEAFEKIDGNTTGVDWEAEIKELLVHVTQLNNNQYVALAGEEDDKDNDTESKGV